MTGDQKKEVNRVRRIFKMGKRDRKCASILHKFAVKLPVLYCGDRDEVTAFGKDGYIY